MKEDKRKLSDSMQEWLEVFKYPALQRTSYDRLEVTAVAQIYPKLGVRMTTEAYADTQQRG